MGLERVDLFGSSARGDQGAESDIDLLLTFQSPPSLARLVAARDRLTALLGRKVDVLTPGALATRPRVAARVMAEARRVA
jgi:predicted nucleotidyltransferase